MPTHNCKVDTTHLYSVHRRRIVVVSMSSLATQTFLPVGPKEDAASILPAPKMSGMSLDSKDGRPSSWSDYQSEQIEADADEQSVS